jgi:hypothetical protein
MQSKNYEQLVQILEMTPADHIGHEAIAVCIEKLEQILGYLDKSQPVRKLAIETLDILNNIKDCFLKGDFRY